jgi:adenylate cyclase
VTDPTHSFFRTLRSHLVFRVATVYAIGGWLLIQFADISLEAFDAQNRVMQVFLIIVLAGFPITLVATWVLGRSAYRGTTNAIIAFVSIFVAVLSSAAVFKYVENVPANTQTPNQVEEILASARTSDPVLAVLPFLNISSNAENEYLVDGMTEDIITLLAQSPEVEVIARNSTFKYKNTSPDVRDVGIDLGADYVVEGSIRPIGERIRVTVQVIDSLSGAHVWAEQFDRPIEEFFSVQDEVSLGIAAAVGDVVFREEYNRLSRSRTDDLSAWALASKADIGFSRVALDKAYPEYMQLARDALVLDPHYALAHALLARALSVYGLLVIGIEDSTDIRREAEEHARLATSLAPDDPKVLTYSAIAMLWSGHPEDALSIARKATELSPSYAVALAYYGDILIHNGRSAESLPFFEKAIRLTPNAVQLGLYYAFLGEALMHHGNFEPAERALLESKRLQKIQINLRYLAGSQLRLGKYEQAKETLLEAHELLPDRSIQADMASMGFYSTDGGGDYFKAVWSDLQSLTGAQ